MDGFVTSRLAINANDAVLTMGYYTRADLPYYYALADAFTICDNYFCSVIGPTDPNRLYTMAASIDPDGKNGGPVLQTLVSNRTSFLGTLTYTTMPEQLQARGISWKVYSPPDANILNDVLLEQRALVLQEFSGSASPLHQNAFGPQFSCRFSRGHGVGESAAGFLADGSGIRRPDHPPAPSLFGENVLSAVVTALMANPAQWAKTVLVRHLRREWRLLRPRPAGDGASGHAGRIRHRARGSRSDGDRQPSRFPVRSAWVFVCRCSSSRRSAGVDLCPRIFSITPRCCGFLETPFGAEVPNLSAWRRATVGDLTSALNFKAPGHLDSEPALDNSPRSRRPIQQCVSNLAGSRPTRCRARKPRRHRNPAPRRSQAAIC